MKDINLGTGQAFTLCEKKTSGGIPGCDQYETGVQFNGDDAIKLSCDDVVLDMFGTVGHDPGSAWKGGGLSTEDFTLRRKCELDEGNPSGFKDPSVEWAGVKDVNLSDLGKHTLCP